MGTVMAKAKWGVLLLAYFQLSGVLAFAADAQDQDIITIPVAQVAAPAARAGSDRAGRSALADAAVQGVLEKVGVKIFVRERKAGPAEAAQAISQSLLPRTISPLVPISINRLNFSVLSMPQARTPAVMSPPT